MDKLKSFKQILPTRERWTKSTIAASTDAQSHLVHGCICSPWNELTLLCVANFEKSHKDRTTEKWHIQPKCKVKPPQDLSDSWPLAPSLAPTSDEEKRKKNRKSCCATQNCKYKTPLEEKIPPRMPFVLRLRPEHQLFLSILDHCYCFYAYQRIQTRVTYPKHLIVEKRSRPSWCCKLYESTIFEQSTTQTIDWQTAQRAMTTKYGVTWIGCSRMLSCKYRTSSLT